jgi:hypothetical protein
MHESVAIVYDSFVFFWVYGLKKAFDRYSNMIYYYEEHNHGLCGGLYQKCSSVEEEKRTGSTTSGKRK